MIVMIPVVHPIPELVLVRAYSWLTRWCCWWCSCHWDSIRTEDRQCLRNLRHGHSLDCEVNDLYFFHYYQSQQVVSHNFESSSLYPVWGVLYFPRPTHGFLSNDIWIFDLVILLLLNRVFCCYLQYLNFWKAALQIHFFEFVISNINVADNGID